MYKIYSYSYYNIVILKYYINNIKIIIPDVSHFIDVVVMLLILYIKVSNYNTNPDNIFTQKKNIQQIDTGLIYLLSQVLHCYIGVLIDSYLVETLPVNNFTIKSNSIYLITILIVILS